MRTLPKNSGHRRKKSVLRQPDRESSRNNPLPAVPDAGAEDFEQNAVEKIQDTGKEIQDTGDEIPVAGETIPEGVGKIQVAGGGDANAAGKFRSPAEGMRALSLEMRVLPADSGCRRGERVSGRTNSGHRRRQRVPR